MEQWLADTVNGEDYWCWQGLEEEEEAGNGSRAVGMYKAVMRTTRPRRARTNEREGEWQVGWLGSEERSEVEMFPHQKASSAVEEPCMCLRERMSVQPYPSVPSDCRGGMACIIMPIIAHFC